MKLHFLATGDAPERYSFDGDQITAHRNGQSESFDLSGLETGGEFLGVSVDTLTLAAGHIIRDASRDSNGELHVTLCQAVGPNHWTEGEGEIDASNYNPSMPYVQLVSVERGDVSDYEPAWSSKRNAWVAVEKETV